MSLKIVFMGTPEFSLPALESIINSKHKILTVYSQPASRSERGQKVLSSPVEVFAKKNNLIVRTPVSLNNENEYNFLKKINPDIVIVVAYGKIIPKKFLNLSKYGFLNIHASLLPRWRGAAPIQRSIMNLDNETGITIMKIVEELDAGPIIKQDRIKINQNIDATTLSKILSKLGAKSLLDTIDLIQKGKAKFIEQDHSKATFAKKISKKESKISWDEEAIKLVAKINGLNPNPGAWFEYENSRYKVWKAEISNQVGDAGETIDNYLTVACKKLSIKILEIQKEGKSRQSVDQFLLGNKIVKGKKLG